MVVLSVPYLYYRAGGVMVPVRGKRKPAARRVRKATGPLETEAVGPPKGSLIGLNRIVFLADASRVFASRVFFGQLRRIFLT